MASVEEYVYCLSGETMGINKSSNVVWHHATVTRDRREALNGHRSVILWFTGLASAGKSTLAHAVEEHLYQIGFRTFTFDGDNVRHGLCSDLGFSDEDRVENIRRVGEMAKLFLEAGVITLTAFISPFRSDREKVRSLVPHGEFLEIYCRCPIEVCEERDVKGLYKRARTGEIKNFTGISSPYEEPDDPELIVDTGSLSLDDSVSKVIQLLRERDVIPE
jgi:adenylylsulfate kinase